MLTYADLYHPPDAATAHKDWNAACGACALAAVLKRPVEAVRPHLGRLADRGYLNVKGLTAALHNARIPFTRVQPSHQVTYGLLFLQWDGPWCADGAPPHVAYRHTHWVGTAVTEDEGVMVYDVNAWLEDVRGAWVPQDWWEQEIRPLITAEQLGATGTYWVRWACQVEAVGPHTLQGKATVC